MIYTHSTNNREEVNYMTTTTMQLQGFTRSNIFPLLLNKRPKCAKCMRQYARLQIIYTLSWAIPFTQPQTEQIESNECINCAL